MQWGEHTPTCIFLAGEVGLWLLFFFFFWGGGLFSSLLPACKEVANQSTVAPTASPKIGFDVKIHH